MNSEEYKAKTDEEIIELIHKGEDKYAQEYMVLKAVLYQGQKKTMLYKRV